MFAVNLVSVAIVASERNATGFAGSRVTLACSTNKTDAVKTGLCWTVWKQQLPNATPLRLYYNGSFHDRYKDRFKVSVDSIDLTERELNLTITSLKEEDTGTYACLLCASTHPIVSYKLTVKGNITTTLLLF